MLRVSRFHIACVLFLLLIMVAVESLPRSLFGGKTPQKVDAVSEREFAFDLYSHLAAQPDCNGKNLFFSPYSTSTVLIMTAEGARGQTAEQMGRALHFQSTLRRVGPDAPSNPWDLAPLHAEMAAVATSLNGTDEPERRKLRDQVAGLRRELDSANSKVNELQNPQDEAPASAAAGKAKLIADQLNTLLPQLDPYELHVANALWVEKTYALRQSYLDVISRNYSTGGAFPVDFQHNADGARRQINSWVGLQTAGRIQDIVSPNAIKGRTAMVLTNAVYFKGEWLEPFSQARTAPADFKTAGEIVHVPMMNNQYTKSARYGAFNADGSFFPTPDTIPLSESRLSDTHAPGRYPGKKGFVMLEMPYKGGDLSMVVALPQSDDGLAALEKTLTAARFKSWMTNLRQRHVEVFIPKFRLETNYKLTPVLQAMGMSRAFVDPRLPGGAQFDGMCASQNPRDMLYITDVLHKAFVEVGEKGTEAAAATAVISWRVGSAAPPPVVPFVPTFRADKPFVFAICDQKTGTILFLGRVISPLQ